MVYRRFEKGSKMSNIPSVNTTKVTNIETGLDEYEDIESVIYDLNVMVAASPISINAAINLAYIVGELETEVEDNLEENYDPS